MVGVTTLLASAIEGIVRQSNRCVVADIARKGSIIGRGNDQFTPDSIISASSSPRFVCVCAEGRRELPTRPSPIAYASAAFVNGPGNFSREDSDRILEFLE